jgi:hypothetical protein
MMVEFVGGWLAWERIGRCIGRYLEVFGGVWKGLRKKDFIKKNRAINECLSNRMK